MSQENVEIVKRLMDAYNRRDVDAYVACTTADFELVPSVRRRGQGERLPRPRGHRTGV